MSELEEKPRSVKNLETAAGLFRFAYEIKFHQLRLKNPGLSEKEIHQLTLKLFETSNP